MSSAKYCSECGASLPPNARFCSECSAPTTARAAMPQRKERRSPATKTAVQMQRNIPWPFLLLTLGTLLLLAGFILSRQNTPAIVANSQASTTVGDVPAIPATSLPQNPETNIPYPEVPRVTAAETKTYVDNGTAVVVDVRDAEDYAVGHLPGALLIPGDDIEARHPELSRGMTIITYCT